MNVIISHFLARKTASVVPRALHRQKQPVTTHPTLQRIHRYSTQWLPSALLSRYVIRNVHHTQYAIPSANQFTNSDLLVTIDTSQGRTWKLTNPIKLRGTHNLVVCLAVIITINESIHEFRPQSTNSDLLVTITTRQAMEDMNAPTNTIKLRSTHKLV